MSVRQALADLRGWIGGLARRRAVRLTIPLVIAGLSLAILHHVLGALRWADLRADLVAADRSALLAAAGFTGLSFAALASYDVFALRSVAPGRVPARLAALTSATSAAVSNLLGFSYLTATALRYRAYASYGLEAGEVALQTCRAHCAQSRSRSSLSAWRVLKAFTLGTPRR